MKKAAIILTIGIAFMAITINVASAAFESLSTNCDTTAGFVGCASSNR